MGFTVSRAYRDYRDQRDYYPRTDRHDYDRARIAHPGPSTPGRPERRREEERERMMYERELHERQQRDGARYYDRPEGRYREREVAYPPRETERDYYYDRSNRAGRSEWNGPIPGSTQRRSPSPLSSRRSSPSSRQYSPPQRTRRPSPPTERREEVPLRTSIPDGAAAEEHFGPARRDSGIPTGPRGAPTGPSRLNAPPFSAPRNHSFTRPPPAPGPGYMGRGSGPPPMPAGPARAPVGSGDQSGLEGTPARQLNRRVDEKGVPLTASVPLVPSLTPDVAPTPTLLGTPAKGEADREALPSESEPDRLRPSGPSVGKSVEPSQPSTPASASDGAAPPARPKLGEIREVDLPGSVFASLEAAAHNASTNRLRDWARFSTQSASLRQALSGLADSEVELAGARVRASVTEAALDKAREEAEMWSLESGRIEVYERNSGVQGWLTPS